MSTICRETFLKVREWSEDPPGCLQLVGRPSQVSAIVREALPDVQE